MWPWLLLTYNKAQKNYSKCTCTMQVSSCQKSTTLQSCLRGQQRFWTITLWYIIWTPESWGKVLQITGTHNWDLWKTASEISVHLMWDTKRIWQSWVLHPGSINDQWSQVQKDPGQCFKCAGPCFQNKYTKYINWVSNKSLNISSLKRGLIASKTYVSVKVIMTHSL